MIVKRVTRILTKTGRPRDLRLLAVVAVVVGFAFILITALPIWLALVGACSAIGLGEWLALQANALEQRRTIRYFE